MVTSKKRHLKFLRKMVDLHAALFKIGASYYQPLVYESKIGINIEIHSDKSALNDFCLE